MEWKDNSSWSTTRGNGGARLMATKTRKAPSRLRSPVYARNGRHHSGTQVTMCIAPHVPFHSRPIQPAGSAPHPSSALSSLPFEGYHSPCSQIPACEICPGRLSSPHVPYETPRKSNKKSFCVREVDKMVALLRSSSKVTWFVARSASSLNHIEPAGPPPFAV